MEDFLKKYENSCFYTNLEFFLFCPVVFFFSLVKFNDVYETYGSSSSSIPFFFSPSCLHFLFLFL